MRTLKELEQEEKNRKEFFKATNKLKTDLKKTWMHKTVIRLLDWLTEKIK